MADKSIFELTLQTTFASNDRLVVGNYANSDAEAITGQTLVNLLAASLDGHGGIQSIVKSSSTGTDPVVDTYTITMADLTTTTFTVTNGLKGDTGLQTFIYFRWAHVQPSSWSDTTSQPDEWMGVYAGTATTPPTTVSAYTWVRVRGDTGETGAAASITSQAVTYMESTSGTVVPSGSWSENVPAVTPGNFLWTRTQLTFNDGSTVTSYSVSRYGIDGTGAVSSVNGQSPDGNGNVALTANNVPTADNLSIQAHLDSAESDISNLDSALTNATGAMIYPTGDSTDRKAEIESKLSAFGYCEFAEGTFYVSDYIALSEGQTVKGKGRNSIIICTNASEGAFVIQNNTVNVTIRDLQIKGTNASRPESPDGQYGVWIGDGYHSSVTIDNCYFNGLGRGVASTTGYSSGDITNLSIVNCAFKFCGTGLKFSQYGEYTNISDCAFTRCYYGCTVTGGNNSFSCCIFSSCYIAFVLNDSTSGTNDGHGAATGCRFNHNDTAITITNIDYGFVFTGCNVLYGDINVTNSKGIIFSSCLMLGHSSSTDHTDITVTNCNGSVSVYDCDFLHQPTITVSSSPYFTRDNCHTIGGTELSPYIKLLSTSYTSNSYVTETDFNRIKFYDFNGLILCRFNLNVSVSPGTSFRTIGSVSLPFTLSDATALIVSSQNNASTLMVNITASGEISIYSASSATGFYRDTFVLF